MNASAYPDLYLHATCLFSKWGFCDGDQLYDWICALEDAGCDITGVDATSHHDVLIALVREYLVPKIPGTFTVYEIGTDHNPIRIGSWCGKDWDDHTVDAPAEVADIEASVPGDVVLAALRESESGHGPKYQPAHGHAD